MSKNNSNQAEGIKKLISPITYWFKFPKPGKDSNDDIWDHDPVFTKDWVKVKNRQEWYESPHIVSIYGDHKKIFNVNMGMSKPDEIYYYEHVDKGGFRSKMESEESLPSGLGKLKIHTRLRTIVPPSGDNDFGTIEYTATLLVKYDHIPDGVTWLPRIIARPLNKLFKKAYMTYIAEELIHHDGEYAQEKLNEYYQYIRKYHGEEPLQSKTRQELYKPPTEEGTFFE